MTVGCVGLCSWQTARLADWTSPSAMGLSEGVPSPPPHHCQACQAGQRLSSLWESQGRRGARAKIEAHPSCEPSPGFGGGLRKDPSRGAFPFTSIKTGLGREEGTEQPVFPSGRPPLPLLMTLGIDRSFFMLLCPVSGG